MVIRMRHTKSHTRNRRSHHGVDPVTLSKDANTGTVHMRHRVCTKTGMYRGKQIIDVAKKVEKKHDKAIKASQEVDTKAVKDSKKKDDK